MVSISGSRNKEFKTEREKERNTVTKKIPPY